MSSEPNGNGRGLAGPEPLVVVRVKDAVDPSLTGRAGATYQSPAQPREHALALVGLLLGRPPEELDGRTRWSSAVAGGRRTITVD